MLIRPTPPVFPLASLVFKALTEKQRNRASQEGRQRHFCQSSRGVFSDVETCDLENPQKVTRKIPDNGHTTDDNRCFIGNRSFTKGRIQSGDQEDTF